MPFSTRILSHGLLPAALSLLCVACVPQSRLDRANTDLAAAQARIKSLEQDLATTRAALDRAKADASNPAPAAAVASAHALPIKAHLFRRGREYQLLVRNESTAPLHLSVTVSAVGRWITAAPIIEAGSDWHLPQLLSGDLVELAAPGYDSQKISVQ